MTQEKKKMHSVIIALLTISEGLTMVNILSTWWIVLWDSIALPPIIVSEKNNKIKGVIPNKERESAYTKL